MSYNRQKKNKHTNPRPRGAKWLDQDGNSTFGRNTRKSRRYGTKSTAFKAKPKVSR